MVVALNTLKFGTFLSALNEAGVETGSARGFWGGVNRDDDIIVTAWIDARAGNGFIISRPHTNHGGLKDAWDIGRIERGATVRLILIRQRSDVPWGAGDREVKDAALLPGRWRVVEVIEKDTKSAAAHLPNLNLRRAIVEPAQT